MPGSSLLHCSAATPPSTIGISIVWPLRLSVIVTLSAMTPTSSRLGAGLAPSTLGLCRRRPILGRWQAVLVSQDGQPAVGTLADGRLLHPEPQRGLGGPSKR